MQAFTSMKKVKIYLVVLFLLITAFSCQQKRPDFRNIIWKNSENENGISFSISETTKGEKGELIIQYYGWLNNNKFVTDTLDELSKNTDTIFTKTISDEHYLKQLPKGSNGYIKLDIDDYFLNAFSNATHYILFYPGNTDIVNLNKDSLTLASMNLFKAVKIITQDEAADEFSKNYPDLEWKHFLDSNPLPSSIELTLKRDIYLADKMDSVKTVLAKLFPGVDLSPTFNTEKLGLKPGKKKSIIYRFTIL